MLCKRMLNHVYMCITQLYENYFFSYSVLDLGVQVIVRCFPFGSVIDDDRALVTYGKRGLILIHSSIKFDKKKTLFSDSSKFQRSVFSHKGHFGTVRPDLRRRDFQA